MSRASAPSAVTATVARARRAIRASAITAIAARIALGGALVAGCSGKGGAAAGRGSAASSAEEPTGCGALRGRIEALYRADAEGKEPRRVAEAVADNTAMVLAECAQGPARMIPCVRAVASAAELERRCLAPLDDEGTEAEALRR